MTPNGPCLHGAHCLATRKRYWEAYHGVNTFMCLSVDANSQYQRSFSQSQRSSLNVESWCLKSSILSLKCATRPSVMSWSHMLLMRSICCASDAVGYAGLTNLLRSDNLASKLFVTVPFSWLLVIAKWWMHWMMRNNILTACAKFWSWEVLSEGPGFCRFEPRFSCPWFEICQNFNQKIYQCNYKRFINVKWKAIDINDMIWETTRNVVRYFDLNILHQ